MIKQSDPLGLISLNANGLGEIKKRNMVFEWLKTQHNAASKIVFLQETHTNVRSETLWKNEWDLGEIIFSHGNSGSKGVAIMLPKTMEYTKNSVKCSGNGRYIAINITIEENTFCIINGYAPNCNKLKDQLKWLSEIQEIIEENNDANIIIGGDLNDVFIPMLDRYQCKSNTVETEYVKTWNTICEEYNLADFWRVLNPSSRRYTWRQGGSASRLKQSRLDYWIVSMNMMYDLEHVDIQSSLRSDHSLISINFYKSETPNRGPSFWRFNASLLRDNEYVNKVKECYGMAVEKYKEIENLGLKWDLVKMEMRSFTVCFSKTKARLNRDKIKETVIEVNQLEKEISINPTKESLDKYNNGKAIIENHNKERATGACIRSKVSWVEYGEKNSAFFLNLEKRNHKQKCITKLIDEETKKEVTKPDDILKYEENFYKTLYSTREKNGQEKEEENAKNLFLDETLPKITQEDKQSCETEVTLLEIGAALKELQNGKSPGSDGFTTEFYKFFWPTIKNMVLESIKYANQIGQLSIDQNRGIINLIPKKDKDPRLLKNWRPISLLNTDYKILTKTLANKLKKVLPSVINPDQVAYLKDRFIGQNIRTILDIMGYTKLMDKKGIIAFLDFEKAFDTIKWQVIYDALELFNIGPVFISWVRTIYNASEACVTNNGFSSPFFKLHRGVRQGCPLSAYLFIMVAELLANRIRKDPNIKGIEIGSTEIKVVQMADDTTAFVQDIKSLENIMDLLSAFEMYAGLRLNKTKTEAMWIGKNVHNTTTPLDIKWVKQVHALGIFFSYDTDSVVQKNFMDRAKEYKRILDMWSQRDLSLIGKITILKSLAFTKITYQCGVLVPPPKYIELISDIAYSFVWQNKPNKIKRKTLIADYENGGMKMLDIESFLKAQKAMWAKRLCSKETASWKAIPNFFFNWLLGSDTWKCNMSCKEKQPNFPDFYWQVLKSWCEVKKLNNEVETVYDIRRQCLWFNENITVKKKEVRWENWHTNGINIIHDIVNAEGKFLTVREIEQKYGVKCDFLKYNQIKDAIPIKWRNKLKTIKVLQQAISFKEQPFLRIGKNDKPINLVTNRDIYWSLIAKIQVKPIICDQMEKTLNIENSQWKEIFLVSKQVQDTKIRTFQYKILFNLIPCNLYLKRITKSDTDKCHKCGKLDDIMHYFYECQEVQNFWNSFQKWWKRATKDDIKLTKTQVIVGVLDKYNNKDILNACILMAKWHIYKGNLNQTQPFLYKFLCEMKYNLLIEKTIAIKNNRLIKYDQKWAIIEEALT